MRFEKVSNAWEYEKDGQAIPKVCQKDLIIVLYVTRYELSPFDHLFWRSLAVAHAWNPKSTLRSDLVMVVPH